jgi:hypothetical protein
VTGRIALVLGVAVAVGACSSGDSGGKSGESGNATKDAIRNVLTLRFGAVSNARALRGTGPFREYALSPDGLFDVAVEALGARTKALWPNRRRAEIVVKEQTEGDPADPYYSDDWSSAAVVTVHPVEGNPARSRMEVHAVARGVFTRGHVAWESEVPAWVDAAVASGRRDAIRPIR